MRTWLDGIIIMSYPGTSAQTVRTAVPCMLTAAGMQKHMQALVDRLKTTEDKLDVRLAALEKSLREQLERLSEDSAASSRGWIWPFVGLTLSALGLAALWYSNWRKMLKLHLP